VGNPPTVLDWGWWHCHNLNLYSARPLELSKQWRLSECPQHSRGYNSKWTTFGPRRGDRDDYELLRLVQRRSSKHASVCTYGAAIHFGAVGVKRCCLSPLTLKAQTNLSETQYGTERSRLIGLLVPRFPAWLRSRSCPPDLMALGITRLHRFGTMFWTRHQLRCSRSAINCFCPPRASELVARFLVRWSVVPLELLPTGTFTRHFPDGSCVNLPSPFADRFMRAPAQTVASIDAALFRARPRNGAVILPRFELLMLGKQPRGVPN